MKKLLLLFSVCAATLATTQAQVRPGGALSSTDYPKGTTDSRNGGFGIKAGVNFADIRGADKKNYTNTENYTAFHAGFYSQFSFSEKFSLQPEILYSRQGFKGGTPTNTSSETRRLDYLQVPVLLVYNFLDNVSIHVGPQVSLLTKVKEGDLDRKISNEQSSNGAYVYDYSYSSLDYGLAGGVEARVGPARIGGRYTAGLNDIIKDPRTTGAQALTNIKNGVFQVYVGVGINN
ncbi:porin family protein [Hymenobacter sp. DG25A]|uniref:porin family protein n=1 Tax=Hymenobacter sp. DG25A TaxID=1385663 RepID=UPI0006BE069F|nr:porin family protein [Hymenobacter sp. DG25A]ALD22428.1 hypothetical protein AM218_15945 [Hymenobacter sp. DG25A]